MTPGTHCTGGWVGPRAGLDTEDRGKIILPLPGIEHRSPGRAVRATPARDNFYVDKCIYSLLFLQRSFAL
jgi:hypothetical protein